ncbi:NIPSNAP family protein [Crenobacter sp. SG2305]|uniref:NIPSNAP family protein n=1 Tax=Crenobacter oryzisoli TaxID=3056844 RepID=UPI0025AB168C|nr:NIPSNAP family protein [Crenobacter sp. SG2305]MDN0081705.1 NIPSNAP family protein [Crenobacter sp. SG2305]
MQRYEVVTLTVPIGATGAALPRIKQYLDETPSRGRFLACWYSDIGALNQIMVIRGYESAAVLVEEREAALLAGNPFGIGDLVTDMEINDYAPFPFLPAVEPGEKGPFYEVRVYGIKPSGLAPTIEAWRGAVPARTEISPLTIAMYAVDGKAPRFMNIWPYPSLDARNKARADAVAAGIWPPKGGPAHLTDLASSIFLPAPFSPLR